MVGAITTPGWQKGSYVWQNNCGALEVPLQSVSARRKQRGCVMYRRCPVNKAGDRLEEDQGTKAAQNKAAAEHDMLNLKLSREGTGCETK